MWFKKKKERVFNVKFIATGFMSNKYVFAEFTGSVDDWQIKHNGVDGYFWHKMDLNKRWGLNFYDYPAEIKEL